jgi:hypothetical protein
MSLNYYRSAEVTIFQCYLMPNSGYEYDKGELGTQMQT